MNTTRAGLRGGGEGVGSARGLHCPSWVACVPHLQLVFPPCCWPSFHDGLIALMVVPVLMGVALPEVAVGPFFSFVCFMCLYVIRAKVSYPVPRVIFYVNMSFVDRVLVVIWLGVV